MKDGVAAEAEEGEEELGIVELVPNINWRIPYRGYDSSGNIISHIEVGYQAEIAHIVLSNVVSSVYRFWCNSGRIIFCRASTTFRTTKKNNSTNYFTNSCPPALIFTPADAPDEAASNCSFRIVGG